MKNPGQFIEIPVDDVRLHGHLTIPPQAEGLVIFAHGSGSSRFSPRNQFVASYLIQSGLGALLLDLLSEEEEEMDLLTAEYRFNIRLLAERVAATIDWAVENPLTSGLPLGVFGASTGAAAALVASAARPREIRAVVSRGGRPDLAGDALSHVPAPTLLLVGGDDEVVLELNREAMQRLPLEKELRVVPGATHLFEEPGTLELVAKEASTWFLHHLPLRKGEPLGV